MLHCRGYNPCPSIINQSRLASRHPIWPDMTSVDTITQRKEDWSSASVVNYTIVTNPTIQQPGFHLPRHTRSANRFRTGQGPCHDNLHKWGLSQSPSCDCGQRQTTNHIVDTCPLTKFEGRLNLLICHCGRRQQVPVLRPGMHPGSLSLVALLKQCVSDDKAEFRAEI